MNLLGLKGTDLVHIQKVLNYYKRYWMNRGLIDGCSIVEKEKKVKYSNDLQDKGEKYWDGFDEGIEFCLAAIKKDFLERQKLLGIVEEDGILKPKKARK